MRSCYECAERAEVEVVHLHRKCSKSSATMEGGIDSIEAAVTWRSCVWGGAQLARRNWLHMLAVRRRGEEVTCYRRSAMGEHAWNWERLSGAQRGVKHC